MAYTPLNIGDFRRRENRAHFTYAPRRSEAMLRPALIVPKGIPREECEPGNPKGALVAENPHVFDIGVARAAGRTHCRIAAHPFPIERRRAQVVRITEPKVAVMVIDQRRRADRLPAVTNDCDLPPAA